MNQNTIAGTWNGWEQYPVDPRLELLDCPYCGYPSKYSYKRGPYPHSFACRCQDEDMETVPCRCYETAVAEWNEMAEMIGTRLADEIRMKREASEFVKLARLTRKLHPERRWQIRKYLGKARELRTMARPPDRRQVKNPST